MGSSAIHRPAYRKFCAGLRSLRERAELSQRELALRLQRPPSYVHKCETGERRMDPLEFVEWCRALKCDPGTTLNRIT